MKIFKLGQLALVLCLLSQTVCADQIRNMPKSELHIHLTGAYPLSYLQKISIDPSSKAEYKNFLIGIKELSAGDVPYNETFKYFLIVTKIVNTYDKVENGVVALGEQLVADRVIYAEIRTGLKDLGQGYEEYLRAVLRGIARCPKKIKIKLLLSIRRDPSDSTAALAKQTVDLAIKYKDKGVVGIDISGDSTLGQVETIIPELQRAKQHKLYIALHMGESPKEIDTPEKAANQAFALELIQPDRIGHGVFLSSQALKWVLAHPSVPIEVCPTSSVLTGMMDHHSEHPGVKYYLEHNHPIVVGTDDPLLFQSCLSEGYHKLMDLEGIKMQQIKQMVYWSFQYAFLSPKERLELKMRIPKDLKF